MSRLAGRMVLPVLTLLAMLVALVSAPPAMATGNPSYCDSSVDTIDNDFGTKFPVVLVHGLKADGYQWDAASYADGVTLANRINGVSDTQIAYRYEFVTPFELLIPWIPATEGPKLAKVIDCVSQMSLDNGGPGRVIVVGYSVGGRIAQVAAGHVQDPDSIGLVVTIAHANIGLFTISEEFAPSTVIRALGGTITKKKLQSGGSYVYESTGGDGYVSYNDATKLNTRNPSIGGGPGGTLCYQELDLSGTPVSGQEEENLPCYHGNLLKNHDIQMQTVDSMSKYITAYNMVPSEFATTLSYHGLSLPIHTWWNPWSSNSCSGSGLSAGCVYDDNNVQYDDFFGGHIPEMITLKNGSSSTLKPYVESNLENDRVGDAPFDSIDGVPATYSGETSLGRDYWYFESKDVLLTYGGYMSPPNISASFFMSVRSASWS